MEPTTLESLDAMLRKLPSSDKGLLVEKAISYMEFYLDFQEKSNKKYRPIAYREMLH